MEVLSTIYVHIFTQFYPIYLVLLKRWSWYFFLLTLGVLKNKRIVKKIIKYFVR